jgi:hypothetical protein
MKILKNTRWTIVFSILWCALIAVEFSKSGVSFNIYAFVTLIIAFLLGVLLGFRVATSYFNETLEALSDALSEHAINARLAKKNEDELAAKKKDDT